MEKKNEQPENEIPEEEQALQEEAAPENVEPLNAEPDLAGELADAQEKMMRALAEAENARKRSVQDRQEATKFAISNFARDLLDVADNLRRALEAVPEDLEEASDRYKGLVAGIEATEKVLLGAFEKNKIRRIDPIGEVFNPNFHEVMFEAPDPSKPAGTIIQVMDVGYILHDRLLRPARVGVVKDDGQGGETGGEPGSKVDIGA